MKVLPTAPKTTGAPIPPSRVTAPPVSPSDPAVTRLSRIETFVGSFGSERRKSPRPTAFTLLRFTVSPVGPWVRIPVVPSTVAPSNVSVLSMLAATPVPAPVLISEPVIIDWMQHVYIPRPTAVGEVLPRNAPPVTLATLEPVGGSGPSRSSPVPPSVEAGAGAPPVAITSTRVSVMSPTPVGANRMPVPAPLIPPGDGPPWTRSAWTVPPCGRFIPIPLAAVCWMTEAPAAESGVPAPAPT
jgi:hypothetical protein